MSSSRASSGDSSCSSVGGAGWGAGALVVLTLLSSCTTRETRPAHPAARAILYFSADMKGYLGPCGCSENMRGGISRAAAELAKARASGVPVFYVDSGDGLFGAPSIPEDAVGQQERKARALADAFKAMGLSVRAPGPMDDARGASFREALQLPEVKAGNIRWLTAGAYQVAVISAADVAAAEALASKARGEGAAFTVALVPQSMDVALRGAISAPNVDLVIASKPKDDFAAENSRVAGGATKVAQVQNKGRTLLRVDVSFRDGGRVEWVKGTSERDRELTALDERIELMRAQVDAPGLGAELKALKQAKLEELLARRQALAEAPLPFPEDRTAATFRFVPLEPGLPQDPTVQAIEAAYDRDVGLLNLAWAKKHGKDCEPPDLDRAGYVGSAACIGCHPFAGKVWQATKHTHAYASLEEKGKQYHLDCIGCHVTGWKQPGGVCRIDDTDERREVGCESCHGPGWRHTQMPVKEHIKRAKEPAACTGCHDRENSPHFDFDSYVQKVLGPGHGQPMPPDAGSQ
ncbi:MAG: cytochrome c family protein [Myxococcota bacterium]